MNEVNDIKYPTTKTLSTPRGRVHCCDKHANELVELLEYLNCYVGLADSLENSECTSCVNGDAD